MIQKDITLTIANFKIFAFKKDAVILYLYIPLLRSISIHLFRKYKYSYNLYLIF